VELVLELIMYFVSIIEHAVVTTLTYHIYKNIFKLADIQSIVQRTTVKHRVVSSTKNRTKNDILFWV